MSKLNIEPRHAMIDLETLGLVPGSAIVSIGAVIFDPRYNILTEQTFYHELDWSDQNKQGFTVDKDTQLWWTNQPPTVQEALQGIDDLQIILTDLTNWLPQDCKVWGNGPSFDICILEYAYRHYNMEIPWKFWNVRDCRTIKDMYDSSRGSLDKGFKGVKHNALDDAINQAKAVNDMWRKLLIGK